MVTRVTIAAFAAAIAGAGVLAPAAGSNVVSGPAPAGADCLAGPRTASNVCSIEHLRSSDVPKPIPDGAASASSVIEVPAAPGLYLTDVEVEGLSITHPWIGDLRVSLTSPTGTTVLLIDRVCNVPPGAANFSNITLSDVATQPIGSVCPPAASGVYRPRDPLSTFRGELAAGTWTLTVSDLQLLNTGVLDAWGIRLARCSTRVEVASFSATRVKKSAVLRWQTASEIGLAGFNVYREQGGRHVRRNRSLIHSRGARGHAYVFRDRLANTAPARYWLESVQNDGSRIRYGPAKLR